MNNKLSQLLNIKAPELYELSVDDVKEATPYLPMAVKKALIDLLADGCIEPVEIISSTSMPVPNMYRKNAFAERLILSAVLCGVYLKIYDISTLLAQNPSFDFSFVDYDKFHEVAFQMEQMCEQKYIAPDVQQIAVSILLDMKEFTSLLDVAVQSKIQEQNDLCGRFSLMMQLQSSPEHIQKMMDEMKSISGEIEKIQSKNNPKKTDETGGGDS